MKRAKYESCILGRGAGFIVVAVLTGILSLSSSACFDTRTYFCEDKDDGNGGKGVRCDVGQTCMPNVPEGICVDIGSCGDGVMDTGEECDDGNLTLTDACKRDCKKPVCGDGIISENEMCERGNEIVCGVCVSNCQEEQELNKATVTIELSGVIIRDQQYVTLSDGINNSTIFKFVKQGGNRAGSHVVIDIPNPENLSPPPVEVAATAILDKPEGLVMKIQGVADTLLISALSEGTRLTLNHELMTARGNQAITSSIANFNVRMTGGAGADCPAGVGCTSNADCTSNACFSGICLCKADTDCISPLSCLPNGSCGML